MRRTDSDLPEFATPDPFVVADVRLSLLAHVNRLNASDKLRESMEWQMDRVLMKVNV